MVDKVNAVTAYPPDESYHCLAAAGKPNRPRLLCEP
jgi:hypothetical protein